jgi:hypothetical protein
MNEIISEIKSIKETPSDFRKFGLTIGIVLILISAILFLMNKSSFPAWGITGIFFVLTALFSPIILKPLNKIWMSIAIILGWIMTRVILSVLFYLALTSLRLIALAFNKNFLDLKIDRSAKSYWEKREQKKIDPSTYERQF